MKTQRMIQFGCAVLISYVAVRAPSARAARGDLEILEHLGTSSQQKLESQGNNLKIIPQELAGVTLTHPAPKNGVDFYKLTYETVDFAGKKTRASGLLMVPDSSARSHPLLTYFHCTETDRAEVPSSFQWPAGDTMLLAIDFGSQGYIIAAPDYEGLGDSPGFHPYFHKDTLVAASVDMLRASKQALSRLGVSTNGQLFLTGYSEGGSTSMYVHHAIDTQYSNEFKVTASAPMAGAYDLPFSVKTVMERPSQVHASISSAELAYLVSAYNSVYGGIYSSPDDVLTQPSAGNLAEAFDGLNSPSSVLTLFNGAPLQVFQPNFVADVLNNPNDRFMQLLGENNGYEWTDWKPAAPIHFYQGGADTEVPFPNSTMVMKWASSIGLNATFTNLGPNVDHGSGPLIGYPLALDWFETLRQ